MVQLLRQLASRHDGLLLWHLEKHKSALGLCIAFIAGNGSMSAFDDPEAMYTSDEEDYFSEDEEVVMVQFFSNPTPLTAQALLKGNHHTSDSTSFGQGQQ